MKLTYALRRMWGLLNAGACSIATPSSARKTPAPARRRSAEIWNGQTIVLSLSRQEAGSRELLSPSSPIPLTTAALTSLSANPRRRSKAFGSVVLPQRWVRLVMRRSDGARRVVGWGLTADVAWGEGG